MGIASLIFRNKIMQIVYASVGVAVMSFYIIIDTQMIIGGKSKFKIAPDEYIMGALSLYLDIIMLFIYIMELIRHSQ